MEVQIEELADARDARDPPTCERCELRRGPPDGERHQRPHACDRSAGEDGVERVGDDGVIRQLRHGERLYRRNRGARLARPMGTDS